MRNTVINEILKSKVIAIVRGADEEQAVAIAHALYAGGVTLVEVTFNHKTPDSYKDTANAIKRISTELEGKVLVGAGTVISTELVDMAAEAGAKYIISPDTDPEVIRHTREIGLVSLPGAYTPTEVKVAHNAGADFVKLFPCVGDAVGYLKAVSAPMSHVKFLAVGGVDADNASDFINAGAYGVGIGGSLVKKQWVASGEYEKITEEAKRLMANINA